MPWDFPIYNYVMLRVRTWGPSLGTAIPTRLLPPESDVYYVVRGTGAAVVFTLRTTGFMTAEYEDVVVWAVLREGTTQERLDAMVGETPLPLLRDTFEANFKQRYGIGVKGAYLLFRRDGCLTPEPIEYTRQRRDNPRKLLPILAET